MIKASTNLSVRETHNFTIDGFKGIDYSSGSLKANKQRAISAQNFEMKDGTIQKRHGWETIYELSPIEISGNDVVEVGKGWYHYYKNGTDEFFIIVRIYSMTPTGGGATTYLGYVETVNLTGVNTIVAALSSASDWATLGSQFNFYTYGEKVLIIGYGKMLVFAKYSGTYDIETLYNYDETFSSSIVEHAYIPTTTISIDPDEAATPRVKATLERPNMITGYRKNTGRYDSTVVGNQTFTLDGQVRLNNQIIVKVITIGLAGADLGYLYEITYSNNTSTKTNLYATHYQKLAYESTAAGAVTEITPNVLSGTIVFNNKGSNIDTGVTQVVFNDFTYFNWAAVDDNITFHYEHSALLYPDTTVIKSTTFGTVFGVDGNSTQLFVSGNATYPNRDYYSYPLDFTYWPDDNYCDVGTSSSAITGYLRVTDGSLAIFKESAMGEPTIFFRTGTLELDPDTLVATTSYSVKGGSMDFECLAPKASAVVAGDPLFLTQNGVYAIYSSSDNLMTNKRFVRERSRFLGDIAWTSLAHAVAWDNKYLLSDGVENVYVADARYRRNEDQDMDDTFQYEWYHLKHIPATNFFVADGELYFTYNYDSMMGIAKFNDDYKDTLVFNTVAGNIAITEGSDVFTKAASGSVYDLVDAAIVDGYEALYEAKFVTDGIYSYIFRTGDIFSIDAATGTVVLSEGLAGGTWENIYKLTDTAGSRTALTIQWATGSGKTNVVTVYVLSVDTATLTFTVAETQTATTAYDLTAISGYASISAFIKPLYNTWLYAGHEGTVAWVTEYPESSQLRLTYINVDNPVTTPLLQLRVTYLYDHEWYTPVFDMGTNVYQKELTSITAVVDPENSGAFYVGYETRGKNISAIVKGTGVMDFAEMSFDDLDFTSEFIKSYTKRVKTAFNYIIFRFTGKTDTNCVLNGLSVQFKVNAKNKGVR